VRLRRGGGRFDNPALPDPPPPDVGSERCSADPFPRPAPHDGSLLVQGAEMHTIQKIMRQKDPRIASETYLHLDPSYSELRTSV
jgi:hypothetical protein